MAARYVAFLRALNTINRRVKNVELVAAVEEAGAESAFGFLASGNVVFDWPGSMGEPDGEMLEEALYDRLGYEVPVIVRSAEKVTSVINTSPFEPNILAESKGTMFVAFLKERPSVAKVAATLAMETPDDRLAVVGSELYWLPTAGEFNSILNVSRVEKAIGTMTVRTINTVMRITDKYLSS